MNFNEPMHRLAMDSRSRVGNFSRCSAIFKRSRRELPMNMVEQGPSWKITKNKVLPPFHLHNQNRIELPKRGVLFLLYSLQILPIEETSRDTNA